MGARFWRNVAIIALAHVALLLALLRWAGESKAANAPEITWLSGGVAAEESGNNETPEPAANESTPEPDETTPATKSEIVLPNPTRTITPSVTPQPTPRKSPAKSTLAPKATPKKKTTSKPSATPAKQTKRKQDAETARSAAAVAGRGRSKKTEGNAKKSTGGSGDGTNGTGSGKSDAATANYYGNMLHDRFYRAWTQPQTVVASGVKLSAVARIRIEPSGRISNFKIVKASGNVLVDESVQSAGKKVTQVDALPAGFSSGGHYDVNVNFALNSQ